jgi:preprotein translocase subunit Sec63
VSRSVTILDGMLDIASAFKNAALLRKIMSLTQAFTQALPPESNELLQLPKIDKERVMHSRSTLKSLFSLNDKEQQKVLGIDSDDDLKIAQAVAFQIPSIEILDAFFKGT